MKGLLLVMMACAALAQDTDRDGLPDALEQQLLDQFRPTLRISRNDCDGRPAEFLPGQPTPLVRERNGRLYGQATKAGARVELHYYHLWAQDCGKAGHELDAEHVSVLVEEAAPGKWRALYWYAAAHEDTICDAGHAARAVKVDAVDKGATIWVSHGKHASFLSEKLCRRGCGGDQCQATFALPPMPVENLGEPGALRPGLDWVEARNWPLLQKMGPDFDASLEGRLAGAKKEFVFLAPKLRPAQSTIAAGAKATSATAQSLGTSQQATSEALATSTQKVDNALRQSTKKTVRGVKRFFRKG